MKRTTGLFSFFLLLFCIPSVTLSYDPETESILKKDEAIEQVKSLEKMLSICAIRPLIQCIGITSPSELNRPDGIKKACENANNISSLRVIKEKIAVDRSKIIEYKKYITSNVSRQIESLDWEKVSLKKDVKKSFQKRTEDYLNLLNLIENYYNKYFKIIDTAKKDAEEICKKTNMPNTRMKECIDGSHLMCLLMAYHWGTYWVHRNDPENKSAYNDWANVVDNMVKFYDTYESDGYPKGGVKKEFEKIKIDSSGDQIVISNFLGVNFAKCKRHPSCHDLIATIPSYASGGRNLEIEPKAMSKINSFNDALAHYRSGAGGKVPLGDSVINEIKESKLFKDKIDINNEKNPHTLFQILKFALDNVEYKEKNGSILSKPLSEKSEKESEREQLCKLTDTLKKDTSLIGDFCLQVTYKAQWKAETDWPTLPTRELCRILTVNATVELDLDEKWDFEKNPDKSWIENFTKEVVPGVIANCKGTPQDFWITTHIPLESITFKFKQCKHE